MMENVHPDIEQLAAENQRLKRQLLRLIDGEWDGASVSGKKFLPVAIFDLLTGKSPFNERIRETMKTLSEFADCRRLVLFHYNSVLKSSIWLVWEDNKLQSFPTSATTHWEQIQLFLNSLQDGYCVFGKESLSPSEAVKPFFNDFRAGQSSVLLLPLAGHQGSTGFIALEETAFDRPWLPMERDLLKVSAQFISLAFQRNRDSVDIDKKEALNSYLLKIAETFSQNDEFEVQARYTLEITAQFYGFARISLFENLDEDQCHILYEWSTSRLPSQGERLQNVTFSANLPGLLEKLSHKKVLFCNGPELVEVCRFLDSGEKSSKAIVPIRSSNHLWGFICMDDLKNEKIWSDSEINTFLVVADLFAAAFERKKVLDQMIISHNESLRLTKVLSEKEQFLQNLLRSVPVGVLIVRNRQILFANQFVCDQGRITEAELIGCHLDEFYDPSENKEEKTARFYKEVDEHGIGSMDLLIRNPKGIPLHVHVIGKPFPYDGHAESYLLIAQDITRIKRMQNDLIESEERSRKILETTIEGVLILENQEKLLYVNEAASAILGYSQKELAILAPSHLFGTEESSEKYQAAIKCILSGQDYKSDCRIKNKEGQWLHVELFGSSIVIKGKSLVYLSLRNITDRKAHEAALIQSERKFRTLTENTTDQIIRISKEGVLLFANNSFFNCYNLTREDSIGLKINLLKSFPEEFANALTMNDLIASGVQNSKLIEVTSVKNQDPFTVEWTITAETSGSDEIVSFLCTGRDVTRRKLAEIELMQAKEKAESADKLKSAFLANMSHEIRTPLNAIVGFSALLKEVGSSFSEKEEFIEIINKSSDNLMALISDIVDIAKIESGELKITKTRFKINELLLDIYKVFQKRIGLEKGIHISKFVVNVPKSSDDVVIETDSNRLTQILNNLLDNALKFTIRGEVEFGYVIKDQQVRFYVQDTGIGIEQEGLDVIFQPFRQGDESISKRFGGTGLGLSICKRLVEAMGGEIGVNSTPNVGSCFYFTLPACQSDIHIVEQVVKPVMTERKTLTSENKPFYWHDRIILVVDDNSSVHLQMRKMLEKTGVMLITARTGASARELIRNRQDIDMVLIDYQMVDLVGVDIVSQIKSIRKEIPIIAASVFSGENDIKNCRQLGYDQCVAKPIVREELLEKINFFFEFAGSRVHP